MKTYFDLLPKELIDMIYGMAAQMDFENVLTEIQGRKETKSIWWNPSPILMRLCRGRGCLQPRYYDVWSLHPYFISYRDFCRHRYSVFDDEEEIDSEIEEKFDLISCHDCDYWGEEYGQCKNCLMFGFPCISKIAPLTDQKTYERFSSSCIEIPSYAVVHQWDISDEPYLRQLGEELDINVPNWRRDIAKDRYTVSV